MAAIVLLALVTLGRLGELVIARRNTRALLARGGIEIAAGHYPLIVLLHAAWLVALWLNIRDAVLQPGWLAVFLLLQVGRVWVLGTLGRRWTTRIIVVPGETLVRRGPYRFVAHPNYVVVVGEIASLPLALGFPGLALLFTLLNAGVLAIRIRAEGQALAALRPEARRSGRA
jgi:methyltransferase